MAKRRKKQALQSFSCIVCVVMLWVRLDDLGASEFGGGWLTGPLFKMAELGWLLFLVACLATFFLRKLAATIVLVAAFLCLPLYLYFLMPGAYRWIFRGEYSVPLHGPLHWDNWAAVGILSLLFAAILGVGGLSKVQADL